MCLRITIKQLRILYSHTYDQLAARARAERQRAARARVGHPVLLALPLQQQLVLVRAGRLILHAHHGRCACWMLRTFVLHARRLHLPRGAPPVHS